MWPTVAVDNWESALTQELLNADTDIYIPQADIDLLPDVSADGHFAVSLVLTDDAGNSEFVDAYQLDTGFIRVSRDTFNLGYQPTWPIGTLIKCRPFAGLTNFMQNHYLHKYTFSPGGSSAVLNPRDPQRRVEVINIIQDISLNFSTGTVTTPVVDRCSRFTLILRQDSTGGHAVTFSVTLKWDGGAVPTIDTTADSLTIIEFWEVTPQEWVAKMVVTGAV